ncbi:MAG: competence/damage-inducible protein A [Verrucomicrobiales bacterium]|nr:competence/damage-inducible protein A [Verrucomicrobiales bacterium]
MNVELINTGSELLLGRVLNTHQQWLCRRFADLGHVVSRQVAVPDTAHEIQQSVREALGRADLVIVTGGLGPTSDDVTRDLIARLLGRKLLRDEAVFAHIKNYFAARNRPMPENNDVQAMVPEGAIVLPNPNGTAPGLAMRAERNEDGGWRMEDGGKPSVPSSILHPPSSHSGAWLIMLPGPPRELRPMFDDAVVPLLQREFPAAMPFVCRTLRTGGIGESAIQEKIKAPLAALVAAGLEVGYCARVGQVDVRLTARCAGAEKIVSEAEAVVQKILGTNIYGFDDEEIEMVVVRLLTERKKTLALAESCTGGGIASRVTNVPGASAVFLGGFVTYSNASKEKFPGVRAETLAGHGAVSEAVAREMAAGTREKFGADFAIAVTGIAGPGGGTADKPVGTVFIALAGECGTVVEHRLNAYEREVFKELTSQQALEMLRHRLVSA